MEDARGEEDNKDTEGVEAKARMRGDDEEGAELTRTGHGLAQSDFETDPPWSSGSPHRQLLRVSLVVLVPHAHIASYFGFAYVGLVVGLIIRANTNLEHIDSSL